MLSSDRFLLKTIAQQLPCNKSAQGSILALKLLLSESDVTPSEELLAFRLMNHAAETILKKEHLTDMEKFILGHVQFRQNAGGGYGLQLVREGLPSFIRAWEQRENAFAIYSVALTTLFPFDAETNENSTNSSLVRAVEKNLIAAQLAEARLLRNEDAQVAHLLKKAAGLGSLEALFYLYQLEKDAVQKHDHLLKIAESGYDWAQLELYKTLKDCEPFLAYNWLLKAAKNGNIVAQFYAGARFAHMRNHASLLQDFAWAENMDEQKDAQILFFLGKCSQEPSLLDDFECQIIPDEHMPSLFKPLLLYDIFCSLALCYRYGPCRTNRIKAVEYYYRWRNCYGPEHENAKRMHEEIFCTDKDFTLPINEDGYEA